MLRALLFMSSGSQGERIEKNDEDESAVPLRDSIKEREQITDLRNLAEDIENDSMCPDIIPGKLFFTNCFSDHFSASTTTVIYI